ncbi:MAG TPA: M2 family metallopeptidase [Gammaproteobacteria bacterium]|nr:M2 family metallopeptidase [Gammaproteobacteria bacterium]HRP86695.1 M2 family metallopeptidase [Gammaproteobacteria bacterium]
MTRNFRAHRSILVLATLAGLLASAPVRATDAGTTETAEEFLARLNVEFTELRLEVAKAFWVQSTYITPDTGFLAAKANEKLLAFTSRAIAESTRFIGQDLDPDTARQLDLLRRGTTMPAPNDPAARAELAKLATEMEAMYGSAKVCPAEGECLDETAIIRLMARERDYQRLLDAWRGWHDTAAPTRAMYERFVELANEGAVEIGFADLGELWKSGYDMPPADFEAEAERLWQQVKPLYEQLHCHVRDKLADHYGEDRVPREGLIPAHLLGNIWAQEWGNLYELLEPVPGVAQFDLDGTLESQGWDEIRMTRVAENFFVSLGMPPLPDSFWERSLFRKPQDRDVVCHASAWPMDGGDDVRLKQCIEPTAQHLTTLHHELGHIYYFLLYKDQPPLYQDGAHDGFHEGIGDTLELSMTPAYLREIGLIDEIEQNPDATLNLQMRLALDKIAFLPFGKLIDQWRWDVFAGRTPPGQYNAAWWQLRADYQGIAPAVARDESDFDAGAKYHIPGNTPYTRYFLARILQFQFHRALCEAAGHVGPLHECSIYGSEEAGRRLIAMLEMGASRPWPDALELLTGSREMDASAIIDYFQPLMSWLETQNAGRSCGW